jgi:CelD/BcsL family acetyltransferase involved in cellulose biosynthesis
MYNLKKLEPGKYNVWDDFVEHHRLGSIYHTSLWLNLVSRVFGHEPHYITLENEEGKIVAGLPLFIIRSKITANRLSTVPCAQSCNPLVSNKDEYVILINYVKDLLEKDGMIYYEMKTEKIKGNNILYAGKEFIQYCTFTLDLDRSLESIKNTLHKSSIQRSIKKSEKGEISLFVAKKLGEVEDFYKLYLTMRKEKGLLPLPFNYFKTMWDILSKGNYIDILYTKYLNEVISAVLLLKYKDKVTYEYGATLRDMMKLRPNQFLLWNGISLAKEQGYKKFDFGRSTIENKDLNSYKLRWGTKQVSLPYYYISEEERHSDVRDNNVLSKIMYYTVSLIPSSISQVLGKILYRHIV